jgi:hypothetical protein
MTIHGRNDMNARKTVVALLAILLALIGAGRTLAQNGGFRWFGPLARVITPNGDNKNDVAFFCFDNFSDSGVSGKIYTLLGAEVAVTSPKTSAAGTSCPAGTLPQYVKWDGTAQGTRVRSGIYVYRVEAEGRVFAGSLLVVR